MINVELELEARFSTVPFGTKYMIFSKAKWDSLAAEDRTAMTLKYGTILDLNWWGNDMLAIKIGIPGLTQ